MDRILAGVRQRRSIDRTRSICQRDVWIAAAEPSGRRARRMNSASGRSAGPGDFEIRFLVRHDHHLVRPLVRPRKFHRSPRARAPRPWRRLSPKARAEKSAASGRQTASPDRPRRHYPIVVHPLERVDDGCRTGRAAVSPGRSKNLLDQFRPNERPGGVVHRDKIRRRSDPFQTRVTGVLSPSPASDDG